MAPKSEPVWLVVDIEVPMPTSWSKAKRLAHVRQPHTQKPDADNFAKAALDGLQGVAYMDDAQVWQVEARKRWVDGVGGLRIQVGWSGEGLLD